MKPLLVIMGPTAVGKSEIAVKLARRLGGEIISADSRQVYRGLDVLTAKPSPELQRQARHHLIGVVEPAEEVNAFSFGELAAAAIDDCRRRGVLPILCGGSGLYIRAVTEGLFADGKADREARCRWERELARVGAEELHRRLARVDPETSVHVAAADGRRIVRALEVHEMSGETISAKRAAAHGPAREAHAVKYVLTRDRAELYRRIDERLKRMVEAGLLREIKEVSSVAANSLFLESLGCRALLSHSRGELGLDEALERTARETRNYAKRQLTWFRKERDATWINLSELAEEKAVERIVDGCGML